MYPLYGALPVPYVPEQVTGCALVAHQYAQTPNNCRTTHYRKTFILSHCSCGTILLTTSVFDGVVLAGFENRANVFSLTKLLDIFLSSAVFPFLFFLSIGRYCGGEVFRLIGRRILSPSLALQTSFNNKEGKGKVFHGLEPPVENLLPHNVGSIINYLQ